MPDESQCDEQDEASEAPEGTDSPEAEARLRADEKGSRRRALDEVFGDVLPDTTSDEHGGRDQRDDEILRDVPPHHT